jgi:two-component system response regulator AtoC
MPRTRVLVVDDEQDMLDVCADVLGKLPDAEVHVESQSQRALARLEHETFDLVLTDIRMPRVGGLEIVSAARQRDAQVAILVFTAYPSIESAVEAIKLGASDYIAKPFLPDDLLRTAARLLESRRLRDENDLLERQLRKDYAFDDIVGAGPAMRTVFETIRRVAAIEADVLILGETGTGKELVARSIHKRSARKPHRFVPVDCGAIPEELLESEFFGHERGAFTGANARSLGLLEFAHQGTFFLDEVAELSARLQVKLLRVLQERRIRRVGGREELPVDVRVVAATSRNLGDEIRQSRFREDLYYRINVARIEIPPLRERREDIPLLTGHFVQRYAAEMGRDVKDVDGEALEILSRYRWPGNVRELQNVLKRSLAMCQGGRLSVEDLPDEVVAAAGERVEAPAEGSSGGFFDAREQRIAAFEREYLTQILRGTGGDVSQAAREARIPRGTFYRLMKKHEIDAASFRGAASEKDE